MGLKLFFLLTSLAIAQCELIPITCKQIRGFVDGHNSRRLLVAKGKVPGQPAASEMKMMGRAEPPNTSFTTCFLGGSGHRITNIVWDDELYNKASEWVVKHLNYHNPDRDIPSGRFTTGENLYWHSTTNAKYELDPDIAIKSWFSENVNFTFGPLQPSDFDISKNFDIGHYTQMVWSDSVYLGCAISQIFKSGWNKFYVACNYGPGGNYLSEKPYKVSGGRSEKLKCVTKGCEHPYGTKCKKV